MSSAQPAVAAAAPQLPCNRCKVPNSILLDLRTERVCPSCHATFIASKTVKRIELLQRETRGPRLAPAPAAAAAGGTTAPQRFALGFSGGPSSAALLHVLHEKFVRQRESRARGGRGVRFEVLVLHVDVDGEGDGGGGGGKQKEKQKKEKDGEEEEERLGEDDEQRFRHRFPGMQFQVLPLDAVLRSDAIDWTALPPARRRRDGAEHHDRNGAVTADILARLPSATSRSDVRRLLVRHLLVSAAAERGCDVLMLGHNTTTLAELTLSETAKGRGFGIPWLVNDGVWPLPPRLLEPDLNLNLNLNHHLGGVDDGPNSSTTSPTATSATLTSTTNNESNNDVQTTTTTTTSTSPPKTPPKRTTIPIYYPLRELFRKELLDYLEHTIGTPFLIPSASSTNTNTTTTTTKSAAVVVSHKDQSIDEVLTRYFADVELNYPSVVANVVRTAGKLRRVDGAPAAAAATSSSLFLSGDDDDDDDDVEGEGEGEPRKRGRSEQQKKVCGICGVALDKEGDERWRGEIGEQQHGDGDDDDDNNGDDRQGEGDGDGEERSREKKGRGGNKRRRSRRLCYGCERSVRG